MKTFKLKLIILAFGTVFLSSCNKLLYTSLDILRPAEMSFDPSVKNLLIVNNAAIQPSDNGHTTSLLNEKTKISYLATDSLSIFCVSALAEELDSKNFFSTIQIIPESKNKNDFSNLHALPKDSILRLCKENNADAILSLDKIEVNDDLEEYYLTETNEFLSTFEVKVNTKWRVYYPNDSMNTEKWITFNDTIYWESTSYSRKKAQMEMPNRMSALIDAALFSGKKATERMIPHWEKDDRYLFDSDNKLMRAAMDSVYVENWTDAIKLWKRAIKNTKNTWLIAKASNNISIAYEILGDWDNALLYANNAYTLASAQYFVNYTTFLRLADYIEKLKKRKEEYNVLKNQLGD